MKAKVYSPDEDADFFDIVAGILQGDTFPYLSIICLDYVLQTSIDLMKENGFTLKKQEADNTCRNYNGCKLCRLHRASYKYTYPRRIPPE